MHLNTKHFDELFLRFCLIRVQFCLIEFVDNEIGRGCNGLLATRRISTDNAASTEPTAETRLECAANAHTVSRAEVVQSMRVGTFNGFSVFGSRYRDPAGKLHWYVALLPRDGLCKIRHVSTGEVPEGLAQDECKVIVEAISSWESQPAFRPN